jgi:hypothetical protein
MSRLAATLFLLLTVTGCYTPLPEHGLTAGRAMVTPEQLRDVKVGSDTREDILMRFGDPSRILAEGDVFLYDWTRVTGWLTFVVPAGFGGVGGSDNVEQQQHFVVAFDEHAVVLRAELVDPFVWESTEEKLDSILEELRSESGETQ